MISAELRDYSEKDYESAAVTAIGKTPQSAAPMSSYLGSLSRDLGEPAIETHNEFLNDDHRYDDDN